MQRIIHIDLYAKLMHTIITACCVWQVFGQIEWVAGGYFPLNR